MRHSLVLPYFLVLIYLKTSCFAHFQCSAHREERDALLRKTYCRHQEQKERDLINHRAYLTARSGYSRAVRHEYWALLAVPVITFLQSHTAQRRRGHQPGAWPGSSSQYIQSAHSTRPCQRPRHAAEMPRLIVCRFFSDVGVKSIVVFEDR